jgi:hypothetical protein
MQYKTDLYRSLDLTLDVRRFILPQELQRSLGQLHNFSFTIFFTLIVGLDLGIGDRFDHLYDFLRLSNQANEFLILGL